MLKILPFEPGRLQSPQILSCPCSLTEFLLRNDRDDISEQSEITSNIVIQNIIVTLVAKCVALVYFQRDWMLKKT